MSQLILIKHATPLKDPARPSSEWKLSDTGREQAARLADELRDRKIEQIITSVEPKAQETGQIIAKALNGPVETAEGLHEHDRTNVPVLPTRERAVASVLETHRDKTIAIVSHGTVISLFAAERGQEGGFDLWRRMGLPSYLVMEEDEIIEVVDRI